MMSESESGPMDSERLTAHFMSAAEKASLTSTDSFKLIQQVMGEQQSCLLNVLFNPSYTLCAEKDFIHIEKKFFDLSGTERKLTSIIVSKLTDFINALVINALDRQARPA